MLYSELFHLGGAWVWAESFTVSLFCKPAVCSWGTGSGAQSSEHKSELLQCHYDIKSGLEKNQKHDV